MNQEMYKILIEYLKCATDIERVIYKIVYFMLSINLIIYKEKYSLSFNK